MIFLARAGRQFLALRGIRAAAHVGGQASAAGAVPGPIACRPGPRAWTAARWRRFRAVHEGGMGACRGAGHPASVRQQPFRLCLCKWKALLSTRRYFVSLASACVRAETVSQGSAASLWRSPAPVRGGTVRPAGIHLSGAFALGRTPARRNAPEASPGVTRHRARARARARVRLGLSPREHPKPASMCTAETGGGWCTAMPTRAGWRA